VAGKNAAKNKPVIDGFLEIGLRFMDGFLEMFFDAPNSHPGFKKTAC